MVVDSRGEPGSRGEVILLTGMSGAGRTTAADVLEDRGWYVVDNLPARMLTSLVDAVADEAHPRVAAVVDVRSRDFIADFSAALTALRERGWTPVIVFFDATDEVLIRRFDAVRRPHPLQQSGPLLDGIRTERRMLDEIRTAAELVLDTTGYNVHELSAAVDELLVGDDDQARLRVVIMSFGFKYGIPLDADVVLDMRFLPNPYWEPALREYDGRDEPVRDFVLAQPGADEFLQYAESMLRTAIRGYLREGRRHVTVAVGCTGGKHRSVATVEALVSRLGEIADVAITAVQRDLGRE
ncbi:MAG TPA: RNase adapter RapZ [Ornithinimicrobium sp.]|uniref:RNase adapter RapZ n=1 Tax=Ornithinimicrobium sp. TaxID=1977084 RepID=UPI002B468429|nr:RNase adapter RapZ [Ornithinimicrobium sp.]HKJ11589.1 RNase adapter RapZ [Ornithinimicrobium sp.]